MRPRLAFQLALLLASLLASASLRAETARPDNYLTNLTSELRHQWPTNRMIQIVCHGHSVPAGYFKTPVVDTFNAYPHLLHRGLKERFPFAVLNVTVTAIGGEDAESGAKRFERDVLSLRPDVVTMDITMPEVDGIAATTEMVRSNPKALILIVSAVADKPTAIEALKRGAHGFLLKPFTDQQLADALAVLINGAGHG